MDYSHLSVPGKSRKLMIRKLMQTGDGAVIIYFVDPKNPRQEPIILRLSPDDAAAIETDVANVRSTGDTIEKTLSKEIEDELPPVLKTRTPR